MLIAHSCNVALTFPRDSGPHQKAEIGYARETTRFSAWLEAVYDDSSGVIDDQSAPVQVL